MSEMRETSDPMLDLRDVVSIETWLDPQWKEELQRDPKGAMRVLSDKYSLGIPDDVEFEVHEDTETRYNLVLTPSPAGYAPAEAASEVQGFLSEFALSAGPTEGRGSTRGWFCNPAICSATTTRCYSHCLSSGA